MQARDLLRQHLTLTASSWSVGEFGALAEYHHAGATASCFDPESLSVSCAGGALRIAAEFSPQVLAYETPSANRLLWNHGVAFCLPVDAARMNRRSMVTELGPDALAVDPAARGHLLFDLGLALTTADFCVRTADPALIDLLRACAGQPWFAQTGAHAALLAASPTRVVVSRLARIEIYNPIPAPGENSPEGPHTHVLPALLKHHRVHDASIPVPPGMLPCLTLYPAHPARDAEGRQRPFEPAAHQAFQSLLERHGDACFVAAKRADTVPLEGRVAHLGRLIAGRQRALIQAQGQ